MRVRIALCRGSVLTLAQRLQQWCIEKRIPGLNTEFATVHHGDADSWSISIKCKFRKNYGPKVVEAINKVCEEAGTDWFVIHALGDEGLITVLQLQAKEPEQWKMSKIKYKTLYHMTPLKNKGQVMQHGLKPQAADWSRFDGHAMYPPRVYCFTDAMDEDNYKRLATAIYGSGQNMSLFKIDVAKCPFNFFFDLEWNDAVYTHHPITMNALHFIEDFRSQ